MFYLLTGEQNMTKALILNIVNVVVALIPLSIIGTLPLKDVLPCSFVATGLEVSTVCVSRFCML